MIIPVDLKDPQDLLSVVQTLSSLSPFAILKLFLKYKTEFPCSSELAELEEELCQ